MKLIFLFTAYIRQSICSGVRRDATAHGGSTTYWLRTAALSADGSLTGYENLLVFAKLYDLPRDQRASKAGQALAFMGLSEAADKLVRTYSGGMIRRLEVAQAMLHQPQVLFLDEPTVGLDP